MKGLAPAVAALAAALLVPWWGRPPRPSAYAEAYCDRRVGSEAAYARLRAGEPAQRYDGMAAVFLAYCAAARGDARTADAVLADLPRFSGAEAAGVRLHMGTIISAGEIDAVLLGRGYGHDGIGAEIAEERRFLAAVDRRWRVARTFSRDGYPYEVQVEPRTPPAAGGPGR